MKKFKSIYYSNKIKCYEKIFQHHHFMEHYIKFLDQQKKYNDTVLFAIIISTTFSSLTPKYQDYEVEYCNQIFFIKLCKKGIANLVVEKHF